MCAIAHEVKLPGVDRNKDRRQRPHNYNHDLNNVESYEWPASTAERRTIGVIEGNMVVSHSKVGSDMFMDE